MATASPLHPVFTARITGIDISRALSAAEAAWQALPTALRQRADGRIAVHDSGWSRARVDAALITKAERVAHPLVRQAMVATENHCGSALYLGAHARWMEGLPEAEGRGLINGLMEHATTPDFIYRHRREPGGVVLWENRAVMHRAAPLASAGERRHMVRATVQCPLTVH